MWNGENTSYTRYRAIDTVYDFQAFWHIYFLRLKFDYFVESVAWFETSTFLFAMVKTAILTYCGLKARRVTQFFAFAKVSYLSTSVKVYYWVPTMTVGSQNEIWHNWRDQIKYEALRQHQPEHFALLFKTICCKSGSRVIWYSCRNYDRENYVWLGQTAKVSHIHKSSVKGPLNDLFDGCCPALHCIVHLSMPPI